MDISKRFVNKIRLLLIVLSEKNKNNQSSGRD